MRHHAEPAFDVDAGGVGHSQEPNAPGIWAQKQSSNAKQSRLAGSICTQERDELARANRARNLAQGEKGAKALFDLVELDAEASGFW
jgi:hypothetical protein